MKKFFFLTPAIIFVFFAGQLKAQDTQIRGFLDVTSSYADDKVSFGFGEQDLFITSVINDRISFLGESVFKFTPSSPTEFSVSVERVIIKYNLGGNHDLVFGKIHTPVNYWNDTYHHGRVFYPTITRPLIFDAAIFPIHTTGIGVQGHDLGKLKFGYDFFIGNGIGSSEIFDNDANKSFTTAIHIKPGNRWKIGASWYYDVIAKGAEDHGRTIAWKTTQNLLSAYISHFGKKVEFLAESTLAINHTDTTGTRSNSASYLYAGYRLADKWVPYIRIDNLDYQPGEVFYKKNDITAIQAGIRYEINYLATVKLEYKYQHNETMNDAGQLTAQFAIGF